MTMHTVVFSAGIYWYDVFVPSLVRKLPWNWAHNQYSHSAEPGF